MINQETGPVVIEDESLDEANGGILIGLLLPAVQKVREGAVRAPGYTGQTPVSQSVLSVK